MPYLVVGNRNEVLYLVFCEKKKIFPQFFGIFGVAFFLFFVIIVCAALKTEVRNSGRTVCNILL